MGTNSILSKTMLTFTIENVTFHDHVNFYDIYRKLERQLHLQNQADGSDLLKSISNSLETPAKFNFIAPLDDRGHVETHINEFFNSNPKLTFS